MRRLTLLAMISLLSACATTASNYTQTVDTWRGGNVKTLFARWGSPDDQATGPAGNTGYFYTKTTSRRYAAATTPSVGVNTSAQGHPVVVATSPAIMNANSRGSMSLTCTAIFIVNPQGVIVNTKTQGIGCQSGSNLPPQMANPDATPTAGKPS